MAAFLTRLPAEIQLLVLRLLQSRDLSNLMLCCRQFYHLVRPLLYEGLRIPKFPRFSSPDNRGTFYQDKRDRPPYLVLADLVQTLAQNPYLASCTKRLVCNDGWPAHKLGSCLATWFDRAAWDESQVEKYTHPATGDYSSLEDGPYDFALLQQKIKSRGEMGQRIWMRDLRGGVSDAWVALLLTLLPNLTRFDIRTPRFTEYIPWLLRHRTPRILGSLSEVHAGQTTEDEGSGLAGELFWILSLLQLPSLRHFSFVNTYGEDPPISEDHNPWGLDTPAYSVTHLAFFRCGIESGVLELTYACEYLKSFLYSRGGQTEDDAPWNPRELIDAVSYSQKTLETLWLEVCPDDTIEREEGEPLHYPSFQGFASLRLLHVDAFDWFGSNSEPLPIPDFSGKLPSSLEVLHIADVEGPMVQALVQGLETYVVSHRHQTPRLREIAVSGGDEDRGGPRFRRTIPNYVAGIQAACAEADIRFLVDYEDGDELRGRYGVFKFSNPTYDKRENHDYPVLDL